MMFKFVLGHVIRWFNKHRNVCKWLSYVFGCTAFIKSIYLSIFGGSQWDEYFFVIMWGLCLFFFIVGFDKEYIKLYHTVIDSYNEFKDNGGKFKNE